MNRQLWGLSRGGPSALKQAWEEENPGPKAHLSHYSGCQVRFAKRALGSGREPGAATSWARDWGSSLVSSLREGG